MDFQQKRFRFLENRFRFLWKSFRSEVFLWKKVTIISRIFSKSIHLFIPGTIYLFIFLSQSTFYCLSFVCIYFLPSIYLSIYLSISVWFDLFWMEFNCTMLSDVGFIYTVYTCIDQLYTFLYTVYIIYVHIYIYIIYTRSDQLD